jgi:integrase
LSIGKDKSGKARHILLSAAAAKLLSAQMKEKLPDSPLLARADGQAWDKETWKRPIAEAAAKAKLPSGATAYTLRHSTITDLVNGGLPLLTVAQISHTSVEMIERHYGQLNQQAAALSGLEL